MPAPSKSSPHHRRDELVFRSPDCAIRLDCRLEGVWAPLPGKPSRTLSERYHCLCYQPGRRWVIKAHLHPGDALLELHAALDHAKRKRLDYTLTPAGEALLAQEFDLFPNTPKRR